MSDEITADEPGRRLLLLGNEAIARGAIEAGVQVAATYPGTPSSEIGNTLHRVAKSVGMYFEFSTNEKVAMEVAGAAAAAGVRSLTFMKHVGLNVASDPFMTVVYTGVRGGMVVITADDPHAHSSQNEQDNRYYARLSGAPMVEPSLPQEAKDLLLYAYEISEKYEIPVLYRTTTRLNHARGDVTLGPIRKDRRKPGWERDISRFVVVPANARVRHGELLKKMEALQAEAERCPFTRVEEYGEGERKVGIITSGVSYNYVKEALTKDTFGSRISLLKLTFTHPLPANTIYDFMKEKDVVIVVEELEPVVETEVKALAKEMDLEVPVLGKRDGYFPRMLEFNPDIVFSGIAEALGVDVRGERIEWKEIPLPTRPPALCPGCPHRGTYYAVKKATGGRGVFPTDIGCYTLGIQPPYQLGDLLFCMGSSTGTPGGFYRALGEESGPIISFIGDSTFFHSGIPGLINAVHNRHRFVLVIMDNATTAMTGHQPHPGLPIDGLGEQAPSISIEKVVKALGVGFVKTVNPLRLEETTKAIREAIEYSRENGVAVVITRSPCALLILREYRRSGRRVPLWQVEVDKCTRCGTCTKAFACPAFWVDEEGYPHIDPALCAGCGACEQVCPFGAITPVREVEE